MSKREAYECWVSHLTLILFLAFLPIFACSSQAQAVAAFRFSPFNIRVSAGHVWAKKRIMPIVALSLYMFAKLLCEVMLHCVVVIEAIIGIFSWLKELLPRHHSVVGTS